MTSPSSRRVDLTSSSWVTRSVALLQGGELLERQWVDRAQQAQLPLELLARAGGGRCPRAAGGAGGVSGRLGLALEVPAQRLGGGLQPECGPRPPPARPDARRSRSSSSLALGRRPLGGGRPSSSAGRGPRPPRTRSRRRSRRRRTSSAATRQAVGDGACHGGGSPLPGARGRPDVPRPRPGPRRDGPGGPRLRSRRRSGPLRRSSRPAARTSSSGAARPGRRPAVHLGSRAAAAAAAALGPTLGLLRLRERRGRPRSATRAARPQPGPPARAWSSSAACSARASAAPSARRRPPRRSRAPAGGGGPRPRAASRRGRGLGAAPGAAGSAPPRPAAGGERRRPPAWRRASSQPRPGWRPPPGPPARQPRRRERSPSAGDHHEPRVGQGHVEAPRDPGVDRTTAAASRDVEDGGRPRVRMRTSAQGSRRAAVAGSAGQAEGRRRRRPASTAPSAAARGLEGRAGRRRAPSTTTAREGGRPTGGLERRLPAGVDLDQVEQGAEHAGDAGQALERRPGPRVSSRASGQGLGPGRPVACRPSAAPAASASAPPRAALGRRRPRPGRLGGPRHRRLAGGLGLGPVGAPRRPDARPGVRSWRRPARSRRSASASSAGGSTAAGRPARPGLGGCPPGGAPRSTASSWAPLGGQRGLGLGELLRPGSRGAGVGLGLPVSSARSRAASASRVATTPASTGAARSRSTAPALLGQHGGHAPGPLPQALGPDEVVTERIGGRRRRQLRLRRRHRGVQLRQPGPEPRSSTAWRRCRRSAAGRALGERPAPGRPGAGARPAARRPGRRGGGRRRPAVPAGRAGAAPPAAGRQADEVGLGGGQAALGLLLAPAVLEDAGRLLDDRPAVLGTGVEDGVELALAHDDVLGAAHARCRRAAPGCRAAGRHAVDGVLALARRRNRVRVMVTSVTSMGSSPGRVVDGEAAPRPGPSAGRSAVPAKMTSSIFAARTVGAPGRRGPRPRRRPRSTCHCRWGPRPR